MNAISPKRFSSAKAAWKSTREFLWSIAAIAFGGMATRVGYNGLEGLPDKNHETYIGELIVGIVFLIVGLAWLHEWSEFNPFKEPGRRK